MTETIDVAEVEARAASLQEALNEAGEVASAAVAHCDALEAQAATALRSGDVAAHDKLIEAHVAAVTERAKAQARKDRLAAAVREVGVEAQRSRWAQQLEATEQLLAGDRAVLDGQVTAVKSAAAALGAAVRELTASAGRITAGVLRAHELERALHPEDPRPAPQGDHSVDRLLGEVPWLLAAAAWSPSN